MRTGHHRKAISGRRINSMLDEDEEEQDALFQEEEEDDDELLETESDTPPHLRDLSSALELGNVDALRRALDNLSGSIDETVEDEDTALHLACPYGYLPCVQLLLERGASLEVKDQDGAIPVHEACASGFREIVEVLINSTSNPEAVKRMLESVDVEGDTMVDELQNLVFDELFG